VPPSLLLLGLFLFVLSIFGLVGIRHKSRVISMLYGAVVLLVLICQIGVAVTALLARSSGGGYDPERTSKDWGATGSYGITLIEKTVGCCGFFNSSDRAEPFIWNSRDLCRSFPEFPFCPLQNATDTITVCPRSGQADNIESVIMRPPCNLSIPLFYSSHLGVMGGVVLSFTGLEFVTILATICIVVQKNVKEKRAKRTLLDRFEFEDEDGDEFSPLVQ